MTFAEDRGERVDDRDVVKVLMVCTGNICRSPAAERLARARWGDPERIHITSAGTRAMVGERIQLSMAHLLLLDQHDTDAFAARQLAEGHVVKADLVLGMTRRHRATIVNLAPGALRRTFTLREFARVAQVAAGELAPGSPADRLRELSDVAARFRAASLPEQDDIVDPYGHGTEIYEESYAAINEAVDAVARVLHHS